MKKKRRERKGKEIKTGRKQVRGKKKERKRRRKKVRK